MNDNDTTPIIYEHCVATYDRLAGDVEITEVEGVRIAVWEGFLTRVIQGDLQLAVPYYSAIRGHLVRMGCIKQLRRGGGNSKSQWEVIKPPTQDLFRNAVGTPGQRAREKDTQAQQLRDLTRRITDLESNQAMLVDLVNRLSTAVNTHIGSDEHRAAG